MGDSANIVFQLLRSALGNEAAVVLTSDIDWREVIDLAFEQGVTATNCRGLREKRWEFFRD